MNEIFTEELAKVLNKKNVDFITFGKLKKAMPAALKKQLGLTGKSGVAQIEKALLPHLGEVFMIKRGSKNSAYLTLKLHNEDLLLHVMQKNNWKIPRMDRVPFKKDEFFTILSKLLEKGVICVKKINKDYKILLIAPVNELPSSPNMMPEGQGSALSFSKGELKRRGGVSEEEFKVAYQTLEQGNIYVRICDLRRHLGWRAEDFDAMLISLRDAGKIQLQTSATDSFTKDDIRDSFIDDRGLSKFLIEWRR